jgi:hypothetical protein
LTDEALLKKIESGLRNDVEGQPLKINPDSKTISTSAGELPISPIFDPQWIKTRRRQKKDPPRKLTNRARIKLANNPYGKLAISA